MGPVFSKPEPLRNGTIRKEFFVLARSVHGGRVSVWRNGHIGFSSFDLALEARDQELHNGSIQRGQHSIVATPQGFVGRVVRCKKCCLQVETVAVTPGWFADTVYAWKITTRCHGRVMTYAEPERIINSANFDIVGAMIEHVAFGDEA